MSETPERSTYQVQAVFDEAMALFRMKNADYGDAWRQRGWMGNLSRIGEKTSRLEKALWHDGPVGFSVPDETARQTALDMINTLAFFIVNWDAGKRFGTEPDAERKPPFFSSNTPPGSGQVEDFQFIPDNGYVPGLGVTDGVAPTPSGTHTLTQEQIDDLHRGYAEASAPVRPSPTPRPVRDNPQA